MKLTKENIYVPLEGKSKEELTELYWLLKDNNEKLFHNDLSVFIEEYYKTNRFLEYYNQRWGGGDNLKTKVTIEQLKEILQPMDLTLEQQLEKAEAEVKRLKEAIEDSKIKVGDLVKCTNKHSDAKCVIGLVEDLHADYVGVGGHWYDKFEKITDSVLLESLNKLF